MTTAGEVLPRRFGAYLLTASLGEDALGRVYRALRLSGDRGFARVRILEGPEISEDAVLDSIQENGEIHTFLKNPAIARGVVLDAAEGIPYLAWNEESGRTLDAVLERARELKQSVPYEHALLIVEKAATALDHAYNTTVDGDRTLHGLVWPGFVSISDDGETRLTGFGLAAGFLPSLGRPGFAREIAPYLAPEERAQARVAKNSDVYSVGAMLFELLAGRLPNAADPLADLKTVQRDGAPMAPEAVSVLRMCLGTADQRFQSSGELRRELGKLLFSGPYSPSTFNLAFFLNGMFASEIDAENSARSKEASLDPGTISTSSPDPPSAEPARAQPRLPLRDRTPPAGTRLRTPGLAPAPSPAARRPPFVLGGVLLAVAAVCGGLYVLLRRPPAPARPRVVPARISTARPTPLPVPTRAAPTAAMTDAQFKEEVARRVAQELKRMEQEMRREAPVPDARAKVPPGVTPARTEASAAAAAAAAAPSPMEAPPTALPRVPTPEPTAEAEREAPPTASPVPSVAASAEGSIPPRILKVVKPAYPPFALRARIGGIVLLRVLVSETGQPLDIQVLKGVGGGLTQSAVAAVHSWRFEPATRAGVPIRDYVTIPIPFEP